MKRVLGLAVMTELLLTVLLKNTTVNQFWILAGWAVIFSFVSVYLSKKIFADLKFNWRKYLKTILPGLLITLALALLPRLFLLGIYPHVSIWDSLKDAGYHALHLARDNSVPIFGFGTSDGYGNFIALSTYYFLQFFGQSFLSYMVPAMIYGTLSVCLLYLILARYHGQVFAVLASALFSVSLTQLFYSRTSVCVITDTFLALLIFISYLISQKHTLGYLLLGLAGGLAWHYYAGARVILLCLLIIIAYLEIKKLWVFISKKDFRPVLQRLFTIAALFFIGWFISVGPTVIYLNAKNFFADTGNHTIIFTDPAYLADSPIQKVEMMFDLFQKGLFSYTFIPATNWLDFFYPSATLMFPLNWFFWIGVGAILFKLKNRFNYSVLAVVLIFTFFAQVIVDKTSEPHRLQAIVPFVNIIAFTGIWYIFRKVIKDKKTRYKSLIVFTIVFFASQLVIFFGGRIADIQYEKDQPMQYVFQYALNNIAADPPGQEYYILDKYPYDLSWFAFADKIEYLTNPREVKVVNEKKFNEALKNALNAGDGITRKFLTFSKYQKLPAELKDKVAPELQATYQCNQKILGILWDCPNGKKSYTYYYYEIK